MLNQEEIAAAARRLMSKRPDEESPTSDPWMARARAATSGLAPYSPVAAAAPSMDTASPSTGGDVPDWAARRMSDLVLDTSKPQPASGNLILDTSKPQPGLQPLSAGVPGAVSLDTSDPRTTRATASPPPASMPSENPRAGLFASQTATPAPASTSTPAVTPEAAAAPPENPRAELSNNGQDEGQTLTDYGVALRKALDRVGAAMGYGLKKTAPVAFGGYAGVAGEAAGQGVREYYHEREDTAPPQSESFKAQEATPWTEAIKHPVTAAGKLAGDVLSAAPEMALATAATMPPGGFGERHHPERPTVIQNTPPWSL